MRCDCLGAVAFTCAPAARVLRLGQSAPYSRPARGLVIGAEKDSGSYLLRVRLARGAWIPPHTHPDERSSTVLSGTLYVGFGEVADEARLVAIPAGGVYVAPANMPHYLWAKDGDVIYQESGIGPTATTPIRP